MKSIKVSPEGYIYLIKKFDSVAFKPNDNLTLRMEYPEYSLVSEFPEDNGEHIRGPLIEIPNQYIITIH